MFGMDLGDLSGIGGLLGGAGDIADLFGGSSDADKQLKLAKKAYKLQKKLALAGQNNGRGLRVYWNPDAGPTGEGEWTTEYTNIAQLLQDASDQNELNRQMIDQPRIAAERAENARQRGSMRPILDTMIAKLKNTTDITPGALEGDLNYVASQGINDTYDKTMDRIAQAAIRSPGAIAGRTSGGGGLVSGNAQDLARSRVENRLKSLTGADEINSQRRGNAINQINSLSGNVFNYDDVPFAPSQLSGIGTNIGAARAGQAPSALAYGLQGYQNAPYGSTQYGNMGATAQGILENLGNMFPEPPKPSGNPTGLGNQTSTASAIRSPNYYYHRGTN